jgi:DNA-binding response OmpR family regulator
VLLIERDWLGADLTKWFLRTEGYEVQSVFDAAQALAHHEQFRPGLAIVDLLVSGGEGLQLCRSLKDRGLPALIAISPLPAQEQALQAGADAFLPKPIDPIRLVSTAKDLVGPADGPAVQTLTITPRAPKHPRRSSDTLRFQALEFARR